MLKERRESQEVFQNLGQESAGRMKKRKTRLWLNAPKATHMRLSLQRQAWFLLGFFFFFIYYNKSVLKKILGFYTLIFFIIS